MRRLRQCNCRAAAAANRILAPRVGKRYLLDFQMARKQRGSNANTKQSRSERAGREYFLYTFTTDRRVYE